MEVATDINANFNLGFLHHQKVAEELSNRATLRELRGQLVGDLIDDIVLEYQRSITKLNAAVTGIDQLAAMVQNNEMEPGFDTALNARIVQLGVNNLPRMTPGSTEPVTTLPEILTTLRSELTTLAQSASGTVQALDTELRPFAEQGLFLAAALQHLTTYNQQKHDTNFGAQDVDNFLAAACHATVLALEDIFPAAMEFVFDPKVAGNNQDVSELKCLMQSQCLVNFP